jgi:hypothetical protein
MLVVLVKVAGGLLPLAMVQPWGNHVGRRLLLVSAAVGSVVLVVYGGVLVLVGGLVLADRRTSSQQAPSAITGSICPRKIGDESDDRLAVRRGLPGAFDEKAESPRHWSPSRRGVAIARADLSSVLHAEGLGV